MGNEAGEIIEGELSPHEKLLWAGRPQLGFMLRGADALLIPFSLMWGGFVIFWEVMAVSSAAPVFFKLWGIPFVLAGLYIMIGRFFVDARQRQRTYYGVTTERIVIVSGLFGRQVKSISLDALTSLSFTQRAGGAGVITFGDPSPWHVIQVPGWPGAGRYAVPIFELAEEARPVYELIRDAQREAKQATRGGPAAGG